MTNAPVPERLWIVRDIAGPTVVATGVRFPSGTIQIEWRRNAFPPEDRTEHPVRSEYQSVDDTRQATNGDVVFLDQESVLDHTDVDADALVAEYENSNVNTPKSPRQWDWDWESATICRATREDRAPHLGEYVSWTSPNGTEMEACVCDREVQDGDVYIITEDDDSVPVEWLDGYGTDGGGASA